MTHSSKKVLLLSSRWRQAAAVKLAAVAAPQHPSGSLLLNVLVFATDRLTLLLTVSDNMMELEYYIIKAVNQNKLLSVSHHHQQQIFARVSGNLNNFLSVFQTISTQNQHVASWWGITSLWSTGLRTGWVQLSRTEFPLKKKKNEVWQRNEART